MTDDIENLDNDDSGDFAEAAPWPPIPDAEIFKGNTLTPTRLRELKANTADPGTTEYAFRMMALCREIMRKHNVSVCIRRGGLHINTDAEAIDYHNGRGENAIGVIHRQHAALRHLVDPRALSAAEVMKLDRSLCLWGARLMGLKRATKSVQAVEPPEKLNPPA